MTLPNIGRGDYDIEWPANRHRVYPGHLFARRFQRQPAVSDARIFQVRSFSNELYF